MDYKGSLHQTIDAEGRACLKLVVEQQGAKTGSKTIRLYAEELSVLFSPEMVEAIREWAERRLPRYRNERHSEWAMRKAEAEDPEGGAE